jgi:hypothetical protein
MMMLNFSANWIQPHRPKQMPDYAEVCLRALVEHGLGRKISLGGAFGLAHYFEYRSTYYVDAWWMPETTAEEQQKVIETIQKALQPYGGVRTRMWGDVVSIELKREGQVVFSFQIARRSAQLEPSLLAPWVDVFLDSFSDILASKIVALVERGAPRDFRDIYTLCRAGLVIPRRCWEIWRKRQELSGGDTDVDRAHLAILTHLARIEQHRPLRELKAPAQRAQAEQVRTWFKTKFLEDLNEP